MFIYLYIIVISTFSLYSNLTYILYVCVYVCMYLCMYVWMDGWTDG